MWLPSFTDCGYAEFDVPDNGTLMPHNASLPDCPAVYSLRRIENPGIGFSVKYSFNPALDKMMMMILNARLHLVQFNVAPMKDTGGTLTFTASLESFSVRFISSLASQIVYISLQVGRTRSAARYSIRVCLLYTIV